MQLKRPILCLFLTLPASMSALAEFESGTVLGTVYDSSHAAMNNAIVTLTNVRTGVKLETQTDGNGNFEFVNQRLGSYRVRAGAKGFQAQETDVFDLMVTARQRVELTLKLGEAAESVTVTGGVSLLETDSSSRGEVINPREIVEGHLENYDGDNSRINYYNAGLEKGLSSYNQPLNDTLAMIYELPFGHARRFTLGDNQVADFVTTGLPLNITYSPTSQASISSPVTERPNLTGQPVYLNSTNPIDYLNPAAFAVPAYTQPFGNAPRNNARMPPFLDTALALHKNFTFAEGRYVQFCADPDSHFELRGLRRVQLHLPGKPDPASHEVDLLI